MNMISKNANGARTFMGKFFCGVERVRRLVKVHLHCIVRNLKKDKRNVDGGTLENFLRTPMLTTSRVAVGFFCLTAEVQLNSHFIFFVTHFLRQTLRTCSKISAVQLEMCWWWSYRDVNKMSFTSFSMDVVFTVSQLK